VQDRDDGYCHIHPPFNEDGLVSLNHPVGIPPEHVLGRDHGAHARPADHVDRNTSLHESPQEPDVSEATRPSAAQGNAERSTGDEASDALDVCRDPAAYMMMACQPARLEPVAGTLRLLGRRRVQELEVRMVDQAKTLADREVEISRLNETVAASHKTEIDLRSELANAANRSRANSEGMVKEKALIEDQLSQSKADRTKLQQEIAAMKREAEQTWAAERVENALLRERINDIAAEIARLTVALEGTDSPIEVMLASEPAAINGQRPANGERKAPAGGEGKGNLADRIRALQLKASRVPATT